MEKLQCDNLNSKSKLKRRRNVHRKSNGVSSTMSADEIHLENIESLKKNNDYRSIISLKNSFSPTSSSSSIVSSSPSPLSTSTSWEQAYSVNSQCNDGDFEFENFKLHDHHYNVDREMTYVKKLTLKFEKLARDCNNYNHNNNKNIINVDECIGEREEIITLTLTDENCCSNSRSRSSFMVDEEKSSLSSFSLSEKYNLSNCCLNCNQNSTTKNNSVKKYSKNFAQEIKLTSKEEAGEIFESSISTLDGADRAMINYELEQRHKQQVNNVTGDNHQIGKGQHQPSPSLSIPGIFIEEIGESVTDEPQLDNTNQSNRLRDSNTNESNFRQSDPVLKVYEAKNRHAASKSLSNYPFESNDDDFNEDFDTTSELFSSKLSLIYDSKEIPPIIEEFISTEIKYIENLKNGIKNYGNPFNSKNRNLPKGLKGKKWIVLGNVEQIYEFHDIEFLPMLLRNQFNLKELFDEFMKFLDENCFYSYVLYTMNKKRSLNLCEQYKHYFREVQAAIQDKLGINSFLVQPIQRLTKYPLLLQQLITICFKTGNIKYKPLIESCCKVEKRLRNLLTATNEAEEINDIKECYDINILHQGKFKKSNEFTVYDYTQRRSYRSKAFIFDKCLIYTEIRDKHLIYRGHYPYEYIGFISKIKSFTLYYHKQKYQECEFTADKLIIDLWTDLIHEMINIFAEEEKLKLKEKYSTLNSNNNHKCDIYRRSGNTLLFRNASRLSTDSGNVSIFSATSTTSSSSSNATINSQEESSPRTTWYADTFDTI